LQESLKMIPKLTKYFELKERGSNASEIAILAREDGLDSLEVIFVLKNVFDLSVAEAKEIWIETGSSEGYQAFIEALEKESKLENQGGIS
jgi:hypothetical protein